jgi:Tfp pilus assembly protein PilN
MATQAVVFAGALIIFFGSVGIIYKIWTNEIADLTKRRNQEKLRQTELAEVRSQNARYQQRLTDLESRINTIQALQNSRVGPVEMMSALGGLVNRTNDVYLYTLAPSGERLQLKGQASTVDSMANFLAFLKKSGSFDNVQLDQFYQDDLRDRVTYKFTLSCEFKLPTPAGGTPAAGGPPPRAGGPQGTPPSPSGGIVGQPAQIQQRLKQGL